MNRTTHPVRRFGRVLTVVSIGLLVLAALGAATAVAAQPRAADDLPASADARLDIGRCAPFWLTARAEPTVESWKAVGLCEIDRRMETLANLQSAVDNSAVLADAHERALDGILSTTREGLRALRAEIEADATLEELRADIRSIVEDYRVYVLVARQVWLVVGDDTVDATADGFAAAADRLEAAIDAAEAAGKDVGDAREHLAAMVRHVEAAQADVDGDAEAVLALTPADWNAGDAQPILREARGSIADARGHLRSAMQEAREVLAGIG